MSCTSEHWIVEPLLVDVQHNSQRSSHENVKIKSLGCCKAPSAWNRTGSLDGKCRWRQCRHLAPTTCPDSKRGCHRPSPDISHTKNLYGAPTWSFSLCACWTISEYGPSPIQTSHVSYFCTSMLPLKNTQLWMFLPGSFYATSPHCPNGVMKSRLLNHGDSGVSP